MPPRPSRSENQSAVLSLPMALTSWRSGHLMTKRATTLDCAQPGNWQSSHPRISLTRSIATRPISPASSIALCGCCGSCRTLRGASAPTESHSPSTTDKGETADEPLTSKASAPHRHRAGLGDRREESTGPNRSARRAALRRPPRPSTPPLSSAQSDELGTSGGG